MKCGKTGWESGSSWSCGWLLGDGAFMADHPLTLVKPIAVLPGSSTLTVGQNSLGRYDLRASWGPQTVKGQLVPSYPSHSLQVRR